MKKNIFRLIILINTVALAGIIVTQIYWVREAYYMNLEQFAGSVRIAMKSVTNQMLDFQKKRPALSNPSDSIEPSRVTPNVSLINPGLLDFKTTEEFNCMKVGENYAYAMIDRRADTVILGKTGKYKQELIRSRHQIPMVGFQDSEFMVFSAYFPNEQSMILRRMVAWLILSILFTIFLVLGFYYNLFTYYRQKRLSEMKTDFINNMTHEFKTPLATISLASEMLLQKAIQQDPVKSEKYSRIIYDENARLQNHVDQILRVSQLEKGQFNLKKKEVDLHELIRKAVENFELTVKGRDGKLRAHYCARNYHVIADPDHITNVIINLLDNANKYSPDPPDIKIGTIDSDNGVVISVEDKGIGISHANQQLIFKKLYRVPTGNLYNVKGFGIGLYYVKTIVEAHGGHIILKSDLNKGSRFDVFLPV
jgi:two-component system phosphate regulon sensor histidine kinase PhoR